MDFRGIIFLVFQILYFLTIISLIVVIISENRHPQKTICWILILIFLPVVGLVIYIFFGENHRRINSMNKKMQKGLEGKVIPEVRILYDNALPGPEYQKLSKLLKKINYSPVLAGNKVDFFSDGKNKFQKLFEDIENARDHIHLLYYKIIDDKIGNQLSELLIRKAQEGVKVRVIYDDVGSIRTKKRFFNHMCQNGVEVEVYLPIRPPRLVRRVNYRNHRKLAVIDGRIGYVGGMNIADCYVDGIGWGSKHCWRDMQIRIEGQGVYGLQSIFLIDWYYCHKESLNPKSFFPYIEYLGNNPLQIVSSGPTDVYESITSAFFEAINSARKYIYIQTPYFIPTEHIIRAMQVASMAGIEVCITIPGRSDNGIVDAGSFSYVNELLQANIKVYMYRAGFIHSKMFVIDDKLTVVGSANMDVRSFDLDFETCAFIYDKETALKAKQIFMDDLKDSELITLEEWGRRPWYRKVLESIIRLFTPLF